MDNNCVLKLEPREVMARNGKTFYFASKFFSETQLDSIAELYTICRYVDDSADELAACEAILAIQRIKLVLLGKAEDPALQKLLDSVLAKGVETRHLLELIEGAEFDLSGKSIGQRSEFLRYCYLVAGVVGLMMCPLLGATEARARRFAQSLGTGMQITNICRDVLEDAQNGRFYLPASELERHGIPQDLLKRMGSTPVNVRTLVAEYLDLADEYYQFAYRGLAYLPFRSRICILLAGEVYRAIGEKIRHQGYDVLRGRTFLSLPQKMWVSAKALGMLFSKSFWFVSEGGLV